MKLEQLTISELGEIECALIENLSLPLSRMKLKLLEATAEAEKQEEHAQEMRAKLQIVGGSARAGCPKSPADQEP